ncbi:tetrahydromethanopterin S-methyltransferase subunit H [Candidatus Bathyarchaeota archaeon]|nr:tetrahydromethanopterin S-methyltransferase subunit H [Candidatus Bathyarchaeota archaeon]
MLQLRKFESIQRIFEISNIKIGGQPGELPTLLIGNIFYKGMPEVTSHEKGRFNEKSVLKWIRTAEELAERTGMPHFLDVMANQPEAMKKYIMFIADHSDAPFLVDGATPNTRVTSLNFVHELGLQDKVVFNALFPRTPESELEAIRYSGVKAAVLLAENEVDYSPKGRVTVLKGFNEQVGLLETAKRVGIEKILVDTIVFDVPSIAYAVEAIKIVKDELGYPAGCSPANATYEWKLQQDTALREGFAAYNASAHTIAQLSGADFLIYGPLKQAKNVIPTCAMNDAIIAYYAKRQLGIKQLTSNHPLNRIF